MLFFFFRVLPGTGQGPRDPALFELLVRRAAIVMDERRGSAGMFGEKLLGICLRELGLETGRGGR